MVANNANNLILPQKSVEQLHKIFDGESLQPLLAYAKIKAQINPGRHRPYYLKPEGEENGIYIREAGTTRHADKNLVQI